MSSSGVTPQAVTSGKSSTTTVIGCGNASGYAVPPFFIFCGKRLLPELLAGASPGVSAAMSDSGWSNSVIFREDYLTKHLIKFLPDRQKHPVLLILDGHKSHVSVGLAEWAKSENIILFVLPAHTSHILQPLDVSCYGPLQRIYDNICHKYTRESASTITRYNICDLACRAYGKAMCPANLQAAFRKTGIYPLQTDVIPAEYLKPSEVFLSAPAASEVVDAHTEEQSIFFTRVANLKASKSELSVTPRRNLSKHISGKAITEPNVIEAMKSYALEPRKSQKRKPAQKSNSSKKTKISTIPNTANEDINNHGMNSPQPGPSAFYVDSSDYDSEESENPDDLCCVCKKFTPIQVRQAVSIVFTKWAQCDGLEGHQCGHWVHLEYCSPVRVIRRGDVFLCPCCQPEQ